LGAKGAEFETEEDKILSLEEAGGGLTRLGGMLKLD